MADAKALEVMQPGHALLGHVAEDSEAAAMRLAAFCYLLWLDATRAQCGALFFAVAGALCVELLWSLAPAARFSCHWRHRVHKRNNLSDVVTVGAS